MRYAVGRCVLISSSVGLGADRCTRTLGQTKKPWARPMRPGNLLGDHGQRAITLALILEPVLAHEHQVGASAPLARQGCTDFGDDAEIERRATLLEGPGQGLQTAPQRPAGPAVGLLLQLI